MGAEPWGFADRAAHSRGRGRRRAALDARRRATCQCAAAGFPSWRRVSAQHTPLRLADELARAADTRVQAEAEQRIEGDTSGATGLPLAGNEGKQNQGVIDGEATKSDG